jgi:hypothetical protein
MTTSADIARRFIEPASLSRDEVRVTPMSSGRAQTFHANEAGVKPREEVVA